MPNAAQTKKTENWFRVKTIWPFPDGYGAYLNSPTRGSMLASSGLTKDEADADVKFLNLVDKEGWEHAEAELNARQELRDYMERNCLSLSL